MYVFMSVCMYVCMHVCMYVCMLSYVRVAELNGLWSLHEKLPSRKRFAVCRALGVFEFRNSWVQGLDLLRA